MGNEKLPRVRRGRQLPWTGLAGRAPGAYLGACCLRPPSPSRERPGYCSREALQWGRWGLGIWLSVRASDEMDLYPHLPDCSKKPANKQERAILTTKVGAGGGYCSRFGRSSGTAGGLGARSPCRGPRRVDDMLLSAHPHLPNSAIFRHRLQAPRATFCDRGEHRAFLFLTFRRLTFCRARGILGLRGRRGRWSC